MNNDLSNIIKEILRNDIESLDELYSIIDNDFIELIKIINKTKGIFFFTGVGKSSIIARKISATLNSYSIRSMFLHSTEAAHGDLGVISSEDILIIISHSGESDEIIKLFQSLKIIKVLTVLISSKKNSQLAKLVNHSVIYPFSKESCMLNLAPSTSSLIQLEIGHLLAITLSQMRNISKETFSIYHPMGLLGKTLNLKAIHIMKKEENNSIVLLGTPLQDAIIEMASKSIGIVNVVDGYGKLYGIFTDGDLRRFFSTKNHNLSKQIDSICTTNPIVVNSKNYAREVIQIFKNNRIDVAPVIDDKNNLLGTIRLIDLIDAGFEFES